MLKKNSKSLFVSNERHCQKKTDFFYENCSPLLLFINLCRIKYNNNYKLAWKSSKMIHSLFIINPAG